MTSKFPMSQGRRTPLSLNAQSKQQAPQGNKRPTTSAGAKAEQNRQQQQQHQNQQQQTKDDKKATGDITGANITGAPIAAKDVQTPAVLNNGADVVVVGNGNNGVANGNNKTTAINNASVAAQEQHNEKKETRNRAVKQQHQQQQQHQHQLSKNDVLQPVKIVLNKVNAEPVAKTAPPSSPSQRKQQQQQQQQQQKHELQHKQEQQHQQQQQHHQGQQPLQQVAETKIAIPSKSCIKKPVEEKADIPKQQKPENENKSSANGIAIEENTAKPIEKATVVDNKSVAIEKTEQEICSPSAKDVKNAEIQSKNESKQNSVEESAKAATPTKVAEIKAVSSQKPEGMKIFMPSPVIKHIVTSCIDDDNDDNAKEIVLKVSPTKKSDQVLMAPPTVLTDNPNATSTPGKTIRMFEMHTPEQRGSNEPLHNLMISGRRSIRPLTDWTPSRFENNPQFRGSYRRIKTELDNSMDTNTSLNVTVGSEQADNNTSWFSFRSRKRERTPTNIESVREAMLSPPKKARFGGIFSVMASPLTALRSRFSKASINNNVVEKLSPEKGVEVEEENDNINMSLDDNVQDSKVENISPEIEDNEVKNKSPQKEENPASDEKSASGSNEKISNLAEEDMADIAITETSLVKEESSNTAVVKKSCNVM